MGLRDWYIRVSGLKEVLEDNEDLKKDVTDLRAALASERMRQRTFEQEVKQRRRTLQKPLQYSTHNIDSTGRVKDKSVYYGPMHDLSEIGRALDVEPYIAISVRKHREQILKEGYIVEGSEQEMVDYIERRLFEMYLVSGVTTEQWLREFTTSLVAYGTAFLVLKRDINKSTGSMIKWHGKKLNPIAAVYPMDPTSVKVKLNKSGHPIRWMQRVDETVNSKNVVQFSVDDIIHATVDKKCGFVFGTPYILPVLDDVRALRRIEEMSEIIAQKHAFPMVHWKVGDKDSPPEIFEDGSTEIDLVRDEVSNMPTEGGIVTSNRVEGEVLGMANNIIDLEPYMRYFESRVMGGLRLSPEDLGRSEGAKASAHTVSQSLQDSSKDFQAVIIDAITNALFLPLLLEGGFDVKKDNVVKLGFGMINREEERAQQAHAMDMFNSGILTRTETRRDFMGRKELSPEECEDCVPEMSHKRDMELAKQAAAARAQNSAKSGEGSAKNKSSNRNRPQNQSGKKSTKTRVKANDVHKEFYCSSTEACLKDTGKLLRTFIDKHGSGVSEDGSDPNDMTTKDSELISILDSFVTFATQDSRKLLSTVIMSGAKDAMTDMEVEGEFNIPKRSLDRFYKNTIEKGFKSFVKGIKNDIDNSDAISGLNSDEHPQVAMSAIAEIAQDNLRTICAKYVDIAYRFAYSRAAKAHGYSTVVLSPEDESSDSQKIVCSLVIKDIPYSSLLSTPDNEDFSISLGEKKLQSE